MTSRAWFQLYSEGSRLVRRLATLPHSARQINQLLGLRAVAEARVRHDDRDEDDQCEWPSDLVARQTSLTFSTASQPLSLIHI